jgi:heat shock protein HtpX
VIHLSAVRSTLKTVGVFLVVFAFMYAIAGALALFLPVWSLSYVLLWTAIAAAMNIAMYFFADRIVLAGYRAKVVTPQEAPALHALVGEVSAAAGLPKPKVAIMSEASPNAFATGRSPAHAVVCFTTGILDLLTEHELRGVVAHELSHVKNRDTLVMTAVATVAAFFAYIIQFGGVAASSDDGRGGHGGNIFAYLAFAILGSIAAVLLRAFVSRRREFGADATGAALLRDSTGLSKALLKLDYAARGRPMRVARDASAHLFIVNPFAGRRAAGLFHSHPPISDRVRRLERLDY